MNLNWVLMLSWFWNCVISFTSKSKTTTENSKHLTPLSFKVAHIQTKLSLRFLSWSENVSNLNFQCFDKCYFSTQNFYDLIFTEMQSKTQIYNGISWNLISTITAIKIIYQYKSLFIHFSKLNLFFHQNYNKKNHFLDYVSYFLHIIYIWFCI